MSKNNASASVAILTWAHMQQCQHQVNRGVFYRTCDLKENPRGCRFDKGANIQLILLGEW